MSRFYTPENYTLQAKWPQHPLKSYKTPRVSFLQTNGNARYKKAKHTVSNSSRHKIRHASKNILSSLFADQMPNGKAGSKLLLLFYIKGRILPMRYPLSSFSDSARRRATRSKWPRSCGNTANNANQIQIG